MVQRLMRKKKTGEEDWGIKIIYGLVKPLQLKLEKFTNNKINIGILATVS